MAQSRTGKALGIPAIGIGHPADPGRSHVRPDAGRA
ncbi:Benzoate transport protein [Caballeronia sordidicola]|nr:Benzoate transport protein [Caballeronia sordidicola]